MVVSEDFATNNTLKILLKWIICLFI